MAVTKQQLAQWSREFAAKNPDKVSGAGSTAQNITTKKSSVTKEQLSQWSREFDKKEAQRQAEQEQNTRAKALQQYTERHISDMGEVDERNDTSLAGRAPARQDLSATGVSGKFPLDAGSSAGRKMAGAATENSGSGPARQMPEAAARALDMGQKWGVPAKSGNVLENVGSGAMAYGTGRAQELRASFAKDSVPDEFDRINQWLDTGDNKNLADAVRRVDNAGIYTDADLIQKGGWTQEQIDEARKMNAALDAIPAWKRGVRRTANTIGGIGDTVAAAPVLGAEYGVQAGKNIAATMENWEKVRKEVKGDEHAQSLFDLLTDVDMEYNPTWPESRNRELISMGYNSKEIREMRQKLAGLEVSDGIDKNQSVGYQLYDRGQRLTAAAQSGLSPAQKAVAGAVTSAAENLAIFAGGDGVAWILPMLSAQGAAEAMGQSAEKGESAGKALGGGLAKFGAGWAINSVGAADLAKTMGSDYAKDTMAGQIADWVQGLAGSSELAQRYPAVAAAISGGIDNSMQAFAETYADMAIDAALGDSEAAKNLFSKDTFLTALESGLSGGASGALGGAVGSGLHSMSEALDRGAERYDRTDRMKRAAAQQKEWEARAAEPSQPAADRSADRALAGEEPLSQAAPAATENISGQEENLSPFPSADAARERSSTESMQRADAPQAQTEGVNSSVNEAAAQSENPAVRQFAEVAASDSLTGKTIGLFTPNAENRENRAAFEQAYGVTLPDTAGATRRMLRDIAAQQNAKSEAAPAVQSAELPSEAASVPQTVQDTPAETADAMPETAAPDNVREAAAAVGETDSYENAPLRETLGLRPEAPKTQREAEVQRALEGWRVTDKAAETISKNMPDRVDADRYAAAASPLYRLGRSGADTFAQALELAGSMSGTAADINYILSTDAGRTALEIAYTQGKGERMLYAEKMAGLGGTLSSESTSGRGEVYAKGTMRQESDPASQIISLNAAATGTDAVLRDVLQNDPGVRAYVDTETARIFFGDSAQDIFGTVLHEDYHWYNALDAEGARTLQEHALEYLAKSSGYESLDEMIRAKLRDYSAQSLTYEQAAEELVADAWRGIFDSEESFKRWVTFQRGQAEKNAGKSGAIHKVMEQVRQMLDGLISRAKEVLTIDPDDRAALKAKRLAEAEKRTLQDEYFAHAEKAMDNLRTAKENAAALKTESAAEKQGVRFSILKDKAGETYIKIDEDILKDVPQEEWKSTVKQAIKERFPNGFKRNGWTIENTKESRKEFVWSKYTKALQWESANAYADKMRIAANLDEIIRTADEVYREPASHKNAEAFNRGKIKIQVGQNAYEADVLTAIKTDQREIFYDIVDIKPIKIETSGKAHIESEDSRSNGPEVSVEASGGTVTKTQSHDASRLPEASKQSIARTSDESKRTDEAVKKTVRFQLSAPVEVGKTKELVAVHNLTEENLKEALELGGMPSPSIAVVKAQHGHSKYGPISLVFGPDAIDPQASRANRVYGSDAWTPTRPNVEYEVNSKAAADFEDTVYEASQSDFEGKFANSSSLQRIGVDEVSSENREELAQKLQRDTAVQLAYLKAQGEKVEPIYRTEKEQFDSLGNDSLEKIIEYAGADELKKVFEGGDFDLMDKLADKAADALEEKYTHGSLEGQNRRWQMRKLLIQENEIMEWEAENQRKAEAWQEKQAQRNAIAIETARQQRDEDVAVAKALAEKRVQKAREGRKADELKRSIRNNAAQLNQMVLRPKPGKYVQKSLIVQAAEVAKLADMAVLNNNALTKLTALQDSIRRSGEMDAGIHADWENSGVEKLIQTLRDNMNASKQAKLDRLNKQLEEAKALPDGDKAEQLRDRLRQRIRETENRTYLPMTVDQLRMLKAITASTLHMIRTENKTLSLARAEEVDGMAMKAAHEVLNSEGNGFGEKFEKAKGAMNRYQLDMLGGTRMFRRLGGYTKNGQMEKLGQMLNDGQRRQTEILVEGESLFANVTGKEHLKEVEAFAGPGAELVDIGLKDSKGNAVPLNHAQLCSLYMLLRNEDSRHHLMTGGLTLPDAVQYAKGNIERAYQRSQTVMLGTLVGADGVPMADTILQTVQDAMTDYDRNWCKDMEDFFGRYTTNLINETSMKLLGYDRATVENYYPIAVDRSTLATEIEGVKMDATIEGRGFLKERVKSDKPILLEECQNVVKRSLRDTAAYAGLAAPIRDVQRVLNSTVETAEGVGVLKDKIIGEKWGRETVSYINDLLTDLQTRQRHRSSTMSRALDRMRGNYAGAILTVNPGVAIAQAASLPTAGAVLGADTMAAVLPFAKNFSGKQRAAVEAEIRRHGDALLQYRLRGTKRGEMSSIGAHKNLVAKASEAMPAVTGWITGMDEITVAALWEGAKRYVERHAAEFGEGAAEKGSEAYWEAVNKMYQRVIEETQPNYTTMQRAGIQRSDNEFVKTLTMFTTQRFQNYGILADAVGDYKAQKARYAADQSAENKAEVQRAGQGLRRAAASQAVQTAVFALMKIGADFLLHRWDKERDENGDITAASVGKRFFDLYTESAAGNFLYGAEIYSVISNAASGADYDVVSATNISAVNDLFAAFVKTAKLLRTDTGEMSEEELAAHHQKLNKAVLKDIQCGLELYGVPAANIRKVMQAFEGYWEDAQAIGRGEGFSFSSAPSSATGQYDRLYNAIQSGDREEAAAAMKKLEQMRKEGKVKELKVDSQLKTRLKKYDADILEAAKAQNAGKEKAAETARKAAFRKLLEGLDVRSKDSARRTELVNVVTGAVNEKANELLLAEKGRDKDASVYADLLDEVENGRVEDVQAEIGRLLTAGKDKGSIKDKITEAVKEEYLAGSDGDREKLEKKLLALEDADGNPLYEEKNFAQWVSAADKKAEKAKDEKNWWEGVK